MKGVAYKRERDFLSLQYLGGSSLFAKNYLVISKGDSPKTLLIDNLLYSINHFDWLEKNKFNISLALIGLVLGFISAGTLASDTLVGLAGGVLGAAFMGVHQDNSIIVLSLLADVRKYCYM